jgi:type IV secretory pathway VirB2 component (pilin)
MIRTAIKQASKSNVRWLVSACAAALFGLLAQPSWAAQYAGAVPWDQTLGAIQYILVGPVAHAVITLNFVFAAILYAVGSERQAGRLLVGGLAVCAAVIVVHLLILVAPF